ncbi:MAG: phosphatase PAP2 family protein [Patescibacteria group bacterium]
MNLDQFIVVYMNQSGTLAPWIDKTVIFFAQYFPYLVVAGFLYFAFRNRRNFYRWCILAAEGIGAALIARGFVEVIRFFFHRPRPFAADPAIIALLNETSYSFPSGHAAFFFALSTVVSLYNKRWGVWFFVASTIIGLARIMAGAHYLTDIIGGAVLGIVVGFAVNRCFKHFQSKAIPN